MKEVGCFNHDLYTQSSQWIVCFSSQSPKLVLSPFVIVTRSFPCSRRKFFLLIFYSSFHVSSEILVVHQNNISELMIFFILVTVLLGNVLVL